MEFFGLQNPVVVSQAAAGGDLLGSHTLCVSTEGRVFAWGIGSALGLSTSQSQYLPEEILDDSGLYVVVCADIRLWLNARVFAGCYP